LKRLRNSVVKWLVVALLCLLLGFLLGKFKQDILNEQLTVMATELNGLELRNNSINKELARLEVNALSDQQRIKSLVQNNKQLQEELADVNNKLFFYERVVAPELETTGVEVYSFDLTENFLAEGWDYQLVLMQSQKNRRFLSGKLDITLSVFEGEELKQVPLSAIAEETADSFKFKYFQTIQGTFSLPKGTTVDEVVVKLSVASNRWYKAQNVEQRYDWRVLTTKDTGDLSEFDNVGNSSGE
jgi:hypothetical protein